MQKKQTFLAMSMVSASMLATPAMAANGALMDALKQREDISSFTEALIVSGVADELQPNNSYTVFAPTNEAFADVLNTKFLCMESPQCKAAFANIIRNHIVPGQVTFTGPVKGTVFSLDQMNINLGVQRGEVRTAAGYTIINRAQVLGGVVCKISGVIATAQELADVTQIRYQPVSVEHKVIEKTTVDKVFYAPDGTPDGMSKVTTYTTEPLSPQQ